MGNVSSRPDEAAALHLRDQNRCEYGLAGWWEDVPVAVDANPLLNLVTISSLTVTDSRRRTVLHVVPNAFPAARVSVTRDLGDNSPIEYVQVC